MMVVKNGASTTLHLNRCVSRVGTTQRSRKHLGGLRIENLLKRELRGLRFLTHQVKRFVVEHDSSCFTRRALFGILWAFIGAFHALDSDAIAEDLALALRTVVDSRSVLSTSASANRSLEVSFLRAQLRPHARSDIMSTWVGKTNPRLA